MDATTSRFSFTAQSKMVNDCNIWEWERIYYDWLYNPNKPLTWVEWLKVNEYRMLLKGDN